MNSNVDLQQHIEKIQNVKSAVCALHQLHTWKKEQDENKLLIFIQILLATLLYACPVWAYQAKNKKKALDSFQKTRLRIVTNSPWFLHGEVIQRQLGITPIMENVMDKTIIFFESLDEHPNDSSNQIPYT